MITAFFAPSIARRPARASKTCRVVLFLILAIAVVGQGCSEDDPTSPPPPPTVTSISSSTAAPGDTVLIGGENFLTPASDNRVHFNNPFGPAIPFAASHTTLSVVVPENAASGPVSVRVTGQPRAGAGPALEVTRGVGDVWVFGGVDPGCELTLPNPTVDTEYLLIPHSTNAGTPYNRIHSYSINPEAVSTLRSLPARQAEAQTTMTIREKFDQTLRGTAARLAAVIGDAVPAPPMSIDEARAPKQFEQFYVLNTTNPDSTLYPAAYTRVTAQLRYPGQHCLIYADVDTLNTGNLSTADINGFGVTFDTQIHITNTTYFGTESDVDQNGRVIILITPVVNSLTPRGSNEFIGGFFLPLDLFTPGGGIPPGTTNSAEIFYVLAADPVQRWGPRFLASFVAQENVKTIAHEYQHLISMSFRLFRYGVGYIQSTWLEEGMSHMAEDLNNINDSNIGRADEYLKNPGNVSLEHNLAPIEQRGGIYLFLRYLGDQFGENIYRNLLQSKCVGRSCVENITGENFYETVDDFLATLYLSGKDIDTTGVHEYTSIDLDDFHPVLVTSRSVEGGSVGGTIFRTSGDFYLFTNASSTTSSYIMVDSTSAGLRTVVVRTK